MLGFVFNYGCQTKITSLSRIGAAVSIGQASGVTLKVKCVDVFFYFVIFVFVSLENPDIPGKVQFIIWSPCHHSQMNNVYVQSFFLLTA